MLHLQKAQTFRWPQHALAHQTKDVRVKLGRPPLMRDKATVAYASTGGVTRSTGVICTSSTRRAEAWGISTAAPSSRTLMLPASDRRFSQLPKRGEAGIKCLCDEQGPAEVSPDVSGSVPCMKMMMLGVPCMHALAWRVAACLLAAARQDAPHSRDPSQLSLAAPRKGWYPRQSTCMAGMMPLVHALHDLHLGLASQPM